MFSGIVETIGIVLEISDKNGCKQFTIAPQIKLDDLRIGDSIAVNGICLTIIEFDANSFEVTAVPETLRITNLHRLKINSIVNLERSLKANSRIGGHYVQGHIDAAGKILEIKNDDSTALLVKITVPFHLLKYIVHKGYIALDGMSITVIATGPSWFSVTFIPHTKAATIVNQYQINDLINIEVDIMGKYIEKLLGEKYVIRH